MHCASLLRIIAATARAHTEINLYVHEVARQLVLKFLKCILWIRKKYRGKKIIPYENEQRAADLSMTVSSMKAWQLHYLGGLQITSKFGRPKVGLTQKPIFLDETPAHTSQQHLWTCMTVLVNMEVILGTAWGSVCLRQAGTHKSAFNDTSFWNTADAAVFAGGPPFDSSSPPEEMLPRPLNEPIPLQEKKKNSNLKNSQFCPALIKWKLVRDWAHFGHIEIYMSFFESFKLISINSVTARSVFCDCYERWANEQGAPRLPSLHQTNRARPWETPHQLQTNE